MSTIYHIDFFLLIELFYCYRMTGGFFKRIVYKTVYDHINLE